MDMSLERLTHGELMRLRKLLDVLQYFGMGFDTSGSIARQGARYKKQEVKGSRPGHSESRDSSCGRQARRRRGTTPA